MKKKKMELKLTRHAVSYKMELHHIELERISSWRQAFSRYQETRSCLGAKCRENRVSIREPANCEHLRLSDLNKS